MSNFVKRISDYGYIEYFCVSVVLLLGIVVRIYKIDSPLADWHSWRQADTASVTRNFIDFGLEPLYPRYHDISSIQTGSFNPKGYRFVEFPIYNILHMVVFRLSGSLDLEVAGRSVSIAAATFSALAIYLLSKRILGKWGGITAAFFYALIPFNVYFTRVILPDPLAVCFSVWSVYLFYVYIEEKKRLNLVLSGILFSLAMLTKPFAIFYAVPIGYLALKEYGIKGVFKNKLLLLTVDIALIPFLLWRIWINQFPEGIAHMKWMYNGDGIRFKPAFWRWIFGERIGKLILGIWGIFPFAAGVIAKNIGGKRGRDFLCSFLTGMFLYLSVIATANVRHDYYQTFLVPVIAITLAYGCIYLWTEKSVKSGLTKGMILFCVFLMFGIGLYEAKEFYKINDYAIIEAGRAARQVIPEGSLVIAPYNGNTAFLYQTGRWGWPVVNESIEKMIEKGARYYISTDLGSPDTLNFSSKFETVDSGGNYIILNLGKAREQ